MGAIDPVNGRRNQAMIKRSSIEASNPLSAHSTCNRYEDYDDFSRSSETDDHNLRAGNNLFQHETKSMMTLSPFGSLKPSASTSCLLTIDEGTALDSSDGPISVPTRASLTHEWKKLKTPNKCRECNLLVYFNGRECSFCGFVAHKKCVTVLVIKCSGQQLAINHKDKSSKSLISQQNLLQLSRKVKQPSIQPIFGQPISIESHQVIDFIRRFIHEIEERGLTSKGIYRVSSIKSKVDRLCNYYDQNLSSLVDLSSFHPNIIANALKMYLRQLPEPLLTHLLYNNFIDMAKKYYNTQSSSAAPNSFRRQARVSSRHRKPYSLSLLSSAYNITDDPSYDPMLIVELREVVDLLPPINRELIAIIMRHLKKVADMSEENQMSAKNLSIIFGPTLLSADNKSLAIVDNVHQARIVELMINWAEQIFPQYANYESKAVIVLDLSESELQHKPVATPLESYDLGLMLKSKSDIKGKDGLNQTKMFNSESGGNDAPQPTETREDLKELRRQFFTVPTVQASLAKTELACGLPTKQVNSEELKDKQAPRSVIKVHAYYCDTLTKYAPKKF